MTASTLQPELALLLDARSKTDYEIPSDRVWAAAASYAIWVAIAVLTYLALQPAAPLMIIVGVLGLVGFVFSAMTSHLLYGLMNRRNAHSAREEALFWKTLDDLKSRTSQGDMKTLLPLTSAEQNLVRLSETNEHSAVLWALLTMIPYAGWVFLTFSLAFVSHDFSKHEQLEGMIMEDLDRVLRSQGAQGLPTRLGKISRPPVILYVVLSLVTLGIFPIVWLYLAIQDPRPHFEYHRSVEMYLGPKPASAVPSGVV